MPPKLLLSRAAITIEIIPLTAQNSLAGKTIKNHQF
jgi:hypothetical protein